MATCPSCGGFLNQGHRCPPRVLWRRRVGRVGIIGAGAVVGLVVVEATGLGGAWVLLIASALGGVLSFAVWKSVSQLP